MTLQLAAILCAAVHADRVGSIHIIASSEADARERYAALMALDGAASHLGPEWQSSHYVTGDIFSLHWFAASVAVGGVTVDISTRTERRAVTGERAA